MFVSCLFLTVSGDKLCVDDFYSDIVYYQLNKYRATYDAKSYFTDIQFNTFATSQS